jgi:hypothetical protein
MPQMIAAPTFQLPQLQAFSKGAQYTEAGANLANQLLQAYMKKLEIEKGDARSAELRDLLVSAGQPYMENLANITPESLEGLAVGADLTQIPEAQRLSTGEIPVEQALGFRAEQGPTGLPLAEEYMRPRIEPDPSTLPAIPNIDGTMPVTSSVVPQYGAAPVGPTDIIPQAQQDLRVIPEIDTAALPQFYTTAEGEKISVDDPNIDRPYIARDITPKQAFIEALQGTDTRFRESDFGPLEKVLFEDIMKAAPGQSKILSGKDLPPGFNKDAVVRQFTNTDGQLEWEVLQAGTAPKTDKYVEYWDDGGNSTLVVEGSPEEKSLVDRGGVTGQAPANDLQIIRALKERGVSEGSPEWNKALDNFIKNSADNAPRIEVNNMEASINKEQERMGILRADRYDAIVTAAGPAQQLVTQLEIMGNIELPNEGELTVFRDKLRKWSHAVGIPLSPESVEKIDNVSKFKAVMTDLLSSKLATQKGPQTDEDARRMMASLASLTNLKEANRFIIQMGIALETRKIEQMNFWVDWEAKFGTTRGALQAWRDHKQKTPIFTLHPETGRHMFYPEWKKIMRGANRGAQNLEYDGKTYENNDDGLEKIWQAQHLKYYETTAGQ